MAKIKPDIEERAKEFVLKAFKTFSDRSGLEDLWQKWDKLYNNITDEKFYQGTANIFPPETRRACKTLINFADEVLFNADPPFQIKGIGGAGDVKKAEVLQTLLIWQQKKIKMRTKLRKLLENVVKYGFCIVKVPWTISEKFIIADMEERKKMKRKISGEQDLEIKRKTITLYDNVDFQVKNIMAMYWDYFNEWDNQTAIIERSEVNWNHLKALERAGIYYGIDRLKENETTGKKSTGDDQNITEKYTHIKDLTGLTGNFRTDKKTYEILECWCNFDLDNDGIDEECVITIVNKEHIIRCEPNPYDIQEKPYLWICWDAIEGTSLGAGVPQLAENSQIALCDFTNQIMDNITAILNSMKIVDDLAEIPDVQLKSRPNGIIRSKAGVDAVKFLRPELTANEGLKAVAMAKEDIRQVTGATVSLQGLPARYDTTATEYQQQGAAAARDVFAKLREIEDRIIKEFLRKAYLYDLQFLSREEFIKIVGEEAAGVFLGKAEEGQTPKELKEVLRGDYDFMPVGVTQLENKIVKGQQLINFLNIAGKLPPGIVDIPQLIKKIWKVVGDGDDILIPQPKATLIAPEDENLLMRQGEKVNAKIMENHPLHLTIHQGLVLPPELEQLKIAHILEHQQIMQMMMQQQAQQIGGGLASPQEQARTAPETITPQTAGKVPGAPGGLI